jgi:sirohydrochlorin cobaltochelatase
MDAMSQPAPAAGDTPLATLHRSGLMLFAHGYSDGAGAGLAARLLDELAARHAFAEITVAFSKQEPHPQQVLAQMTAERVLIVPLQIGAGRVAGRMLPEFLANSPDRDRATILEPLGCDPDMALLAVDLINQTMDKAGLDPKRTAVLVAGQGSKNENANFAATQKLADALRAKGRYGETAAVFQRQEPFADRWRDAVTLPDVVALPFFISGGHHEDKAMPVCLRKGGATLDGGEVDGRRMWLTPSVGRHPRLSGVVLDMALRAVMEPPA